MPASKHERAKARAKLLRQWWGNAYMGTRDDRHNTTSFAGVQSARLDAWTHGMKVGFAAGYKLGRKK